MKNRIAHLLEQLDQVPQQPVKKQKKPFLPKNGTPERRRKGKKLIARILARLGGGEEKMCIYVDGSGQYYVRGDKVNPRQALRSFLIWECLGDDVRKEAVDLQEMYHLLQTVLPHENDEPEKNDDDENAGEDWKAGAE
jgi:hypothetical protein